MRGSGLALLLWAGLLAPAGASADLWVALASFSEIERAEAVRDQYSASLFELAVTRASTSRGDMYRVVHGPVADRAAATALIEQARTAGFGSPWIVHAINETYVAASDGLGTASDWDEGTVSANLDDDVEALLRSLDDDDQYLSTLDDYEPLPGYEDLYDGATDEGLGGVRAEDYVAPTRGNEELVQEAPENWGLNRLRR